MHELAIAQGIIDTVTGRLPGSRVSLVSLEIGPLSGVVPDALLFCFDLATEGTGLAGARLEISEPPARCRCRECGSEFAPDGPILLCPCGSADAEVLSGQDLRITAVKVAA
ncbi:MAG: hydrogenase maturation nickel metallochaperone HypA [Actinobacteria bacterium]|nr:hydrogenase maturation nickel metallochaperone HypA [Actinomycetota bacterium]MBO0784706.1 hydrogenase maturation nickel metallochaperone HypA [Actinomycetota bacterium]MBO0818719.1 hydrogenase maturation nickel metallochaperone HypA [Actinomycetota bacterium]